MKRTNSVNLKPANYIAICHRPIFGKRTVQALLTGLGSRAWHGVCQHSKENGVF
jgi:hypothetical protein